MSSAQEAGLLQTDRLDLRPLTPRDLDLLHPIISDPRNCVHIPEGPHNSLEASLADPALPMVAWIHQDNAASQAVARHIGLKDYGLLEPQHWDGEPMHYWADREPDRV